VDDADSERGLSEALIHPRHPLLHPQCKRFVSLCAAKILVAAKGRSVKSAGYTLSK
jgi:hypothetical protein